MHDPPVSTFATLGAPCGHACFNALLPNGKPLLAHLPKHLSHLNPQLLPGSRVLLELTPFDFDHGRIAGLADLPGETPRAARPTHSTT